VCVLISFTQGCIPEGRGCALYAPMLSRDGYSKGDISLHTHLGGIHINTIGNAPSKNETYPHSLFTKICCFEPPSLVITTIY
jgi:hypothetical protein